MNDVSLKEYIEKILIERDKAIEADHTSMESRLKLLNELRTDVMGRGEYNRVHEALVERVRQVELTAVKSAVIVSLVTSISSGIVLALVAHWIKP